MSNSRKSPSDSKLQFCAKGWTITPVSGQMHFGAGFLKDVSVLGCTHPWLSSVQSPSPYHGAIAKKVKFLSQTREPVSSCTQSPLNAAWQTLGLGVVTQLTAWAALGRVLVIPNAFHFTGTAATVLLVPLKASLQCIYALQRSTWFLSKFVASKLYPTISHCSVGSYSAIPLHIFLFSNKLYIK